MVADCPSPISFSFPKKEKLCRKKSIETLLSGGSVVFVYPLKVVWNTVGDGDAPIQMMVSVPKRLFKKAVVRNRIKRRIREAFRLHKHLFALSLPSGKSLHLLWIFVAREELSYSGIELAVKKIILQWSGNEKGA